MPLWTCSAELSNSRLTVPSTSALTAADVCAGVQSVQIKELKSRIEELEKKETKNAGARQQVRLMPAFW